MSILRVGAVQLAAGVDKAVNLLTIDRLLNQAANAGCQLAALPEVASYRGRHVAAGAEPLEGPTTVFLRERARQHGMWILGGSLLERVADGDERVFNTSVLIDPRGDTAAVYRKIHLFDVEIRDGPSTRESTRVRPGTEVVTAEVDGIPVGLSVCYDLRFPELYRLLAARGARVLFVPANFTAHTGRAHWDVLLRARAIENQAFVVAPGQFGVSDDAIPSHGNSMIVDPWGVVLARAEEGETVVVADLDFSRLDQVRAELPSLANRRLPLSDPSRVPAAAER
jgi:deaminated glutathione amidase